MRKVTHFCFASALLLQPALGFAQGRVSLDAGAATPRITHAPADAGRIDEEQFVSIGGIEQWVTIHGASRENPVILFIHGGPGNPMSPYAKNLYTAWEKSFTLVQWDQRGSGKTYGRNPGAEESKLTIDLMTQDGVELASHLAKHLGKKKIILVGGSWGSVLGVHMAKSRPDLFLAYVGAGQLVNYSENMDASRRRVIELARAAGDAKTVATIEAIGPTPWVDPHNFGILRRATRVYEAKTTTPAPKSWWVPDPAYTTPKMQADYDSGEDYSYLQFVGMKGDGMLSQIDLPKLGLAFAIPIFIIEGSEDLVTMPEVAKHYFDTLTAPQKAFVLLPRTGHDPNAAMLDAEFDILKKRVLPLAN